MNALSPHYPEADRGPQSPSRKARRFPRFPLVLGLGLLGFSIAATLFGMKTGIGTVLNVYGQPQAVRDIVIAGAHDTEITISDARTGEPIITLAPEEGGFVRGSLRALSRMRLMAETPERAALPADQMGERLRVALRYRHRRTDLSQCLRA